MFGKFSDLPLNDTPWIQRLRGVRQTGNTNHVYMFSEHSRFGHSLGVAYLAITLMNKLEKYSPEQVAPYRDAVAAAALLHDIGHIAPGSHLAERIWGAAGGGLHEDVTSRIVEEDPEITAILSSRAGSLRESVRRILAEDSSMPRWTVSILSGGRMERRSRQLGDSRQRYVRCNLRALQCLRIDRRFPS